MVLQKKINKKRILLIITAAAIVGTAALWIISHRKPEKSPAYFTVTRRDILNTEGLSGSVSFRDSFGVIPPSESNVDKVLVAVGDRVEAGDVLFTLDMSELNDELNEYICAYDEAVESQRRALESEQTQSALTEKNREKMISLAEHEYSAAVIERDRLAKHIDEYRAVLDECEQQCDRYYKEMIKLQPDTENSGEDDAQVSPEFIRARTSYELFTERCVLYRSLIESASSELESAEENVSELNHSLEIIQLSNQVNVKTYYDSSMIRYYENKISYLRRVIERAECCSPVSGIVTAINAESGSPCRNGAAMVISDTDTKTIFLDVSPAKRNRIGNNMEVILTSDMIGSDAIKGRITYISSIPVDGKYKAEVEVGGNELDKLPGGGKVYARVITSQRKDVIAVPYESIVVEDGKSYVYAADGNKSEKTEVIPGMMTDYYTEVTGIEPGTVIYLSGEEGKALEKGAEK